MSEYLDENSLVDLRYFFLIKELVQLGDALLIEIVSAGYIVNDKNFSIKFDIEASMSVGVCPVDLGLYSKDSIRIWRVIHLPLRSIGSSNLSTLPTRFLS